MAQHCLFLFERLSTKLWNRRRDKIRIATKPCHQLFHHIFKQHLTALLFCAYRKPFKPITIGKPWAINYTSKKKTNSNELCTAVVFPSFSFGHLRIDWLIIWYDQKEVVSSTLNDRRFFCGSNFYEFVLGTNIGEGGYLGDAQKSRYALSKANKKFILIYFLVDC